MLQENQSRKVYPSDVTDEPWTLVAPRLPPAKSHPRGGRPRQVDLRAVLNTIRYLQRSGGPWDRLPHDLLPTSTVCAYCAPWRDDGPWTQVGPAWREQTRVAAGREPTPSALGIASPSVQTTEVGGAERGDASGTQVQGRQRHRLVATFGWLMAGWMTGAGLDEGQAAPQWLARRSAAAFPRLETIFGDNTDPKHALYPWRALQRPPGRLAIKTRPEGSTGFTPWRQRWVVERTKAWNGRGRRHSKDYERKPASSAAMVQLSHRNLMLNRLSKHPSPAFHYRQKAA